MASTDWENVRQYVEPVVSEIDQPEAELVRIEVVLLGEVRRVAKLLQQRADRIEAGNAAAEGEPESG